MLLFIAGFILGGMFGVFMMAILAAGRDDR